MNFRVDAPNPQFRGTVATVSFTAGRAEVDTSTRAGRAALAYFRRRPEYRVTEAAELVEVDLADAATETPAPDGGTRLPMPRRSASTDEWRTWATDPAGGGMDPAEAATHTRDELVAHYAKDGDQ